MSKRSRFLIVLGIGLSISVSTGYPRETTPSVAASLRNENFSELNRYYSSIQSRFRDGKASAGELRDAFRAFDVTDRDLAVRYDAWVRSFPKSYVARLARAIYYKNIGYEERGDKYISETSTLQLEKMDAAMKKAISDFGASITMDPKPFLSFFYMIGIIRSYAGPAYSRKMYDEAIRLAPSFLDTRREYMLSLEDKWGGSLEQMRGYFEECKREALPTSQLNLLEAMIYEDQASELEEQGDHAGAESAYRKTLELGGADCDTCIAAALSKVLIAENKISEAIPFLTRYIDDHPSDMGAVGWRGSLYLKIGKVPEAVVDITKAADAGLADMQNQLGVLYMTGVPGYMTVNAEEGVKWLRKAAAQGDADAERNLPTAEKILTLINEAKANDARNGISLPAPPEPSPISPE